LTYPQPDYVSQLIARSTGILGDFRLPVCTQIIAREHPSLSEDDVSRILRRYRSHVEFWNTNSSVVQLELQNFARALGWLYPQVFQIYESLNWVGLLRYQCGTDFSPWSRALQAQGIEFRTWFGQVSNRCYLMVRSRDHFRASAIVSTQYGPNPFELVQPWEETI
jgi:hypothetical protein